ncbi:hypothetical protein ACVIIW_003626 [Bradyrhizobium sp. USDA 4449]
MFPLAILLFLTGATLAWTFRVWVIVPVTMLAIPIGLGLMLALGSDFLGAVGGTLLIGVMPQLGYALGLLTRSTLAAMRTPRTSRTASVAMLFRKRSIDSMR